MSTLEELFTTNKFVIHIAEKEKNELQEEANCLQMGRFQNQIQTLTIPHTYIPERQGLGIGMDIAIEHSFSMNFFLPFSTPRQSGRFEICRSMSSFFFPEILMASILAQTPFLIYHTYNSSQLLSLSLLLHIAWNEMQSSKAYTYKAIWNLLPIYLYSIIFLLYTF